MFCFYVERYIFLTLVIFPLPLPLSLSTFLHMMEWFSHAVNIVTCTALLKQRHKKSMKRHTEIALHLCSFSTYSTWKIKSNVISLSFYLHVFYACARGGRRWKSVIQSIWLMKNSYIFRMYDAYVIRFVVVVAVARLHCHARFRRHEKVKLIDNRPPSNRLYTITISNITNTLIPFQLQTAQRVKRVRESNQQLFLCSTLHVRRCWFGKVHGVHMNRTIKIRMRDCNFRYRFGFVVRTMWQQQF